MPTPKKSFAKAFFEDIKETAPVDNTRTTKPAATKTLTAKAREEDAKAGAETKRLLDGAESREREADNLSKRKDQLSQDVAYAMRGQADYLRKEANWVYPDTRVGKTFTDQKREEDIKRYDDENKKLKAEESEQNAKKFEQNLHKYDKGRKMKRELREMDSTPEMLKKPKQKSFAKKFFEDID